ncbi:MAG: hypothetical protein ACRCV0_02310, partial [Brevinema sp.]
TTLFITLSFLYSFIYPIQKIRKEKNRIERINQEKEEFIRSVAQELNQGLHPISTSINLSANEEVYYEVSHTNWQEMRKERTSISYGGLTHSINLGKGLRFRLGNITPITHSRDELKTIEIGKLYITNKKLLLIGSQSTKNIPLNKIVDIELFSDAIGIKRETGKIVYFRLFFKDLVYVQSILEKLLYP